MKKIELKVAINCNKCKTQVMKAVTKLQGVDQVNVDAGKGILTVIGDVDPVCVTNQVRRTGKNAEIISVGPLKKDDPPKPKDDPPKPNPVTILLPPSCPESHVYISTYDSYDRCTIL